MGEPFATISNPTPTEVRAIASTFIDQEYRLFISVPADYATSDKIFPVLYLLDGNATFAIVRQFTELLTAFGQIPEIIIIGVGYPLDTYMVRRPFVDVIFRSLKCRLKKRQKQTIHLGKQAEDRISTTSSQKN